MWYRGSLSSYTCLCEAVSKSKATNGVIKALPRGQPASSDQKAKTAARWLPVWTSFAIYQLTFLKPGADPFLQHRLLISIPQDLLSNTLGELPPSFPPLEFLACACRQRQSGTIADVTFTAGMIIRYNFAGISPFSRTQGQLRCACSPHHALPLSQVVGKSQPDS